MYRMSRGDKCIRKKGRAELEGSSVLLGTGQVEISHRMVRVASREGDI
jgi:hypothetical protein